MPEKRQRTEDELPKFEVTRSVFAKRALVAGWQQRTIDLFLLPSCPMPLKYTCVGEEALRVID
jgi:hypothetical protein